MGPDGAIATIHALGPLRLDAEAEILFSGAEPLPAGKRAVALLRVLMERPGPPVCKDALIEAAWPGRAVEESNLPVQFAAVRRAPAPKPGGIETLERRGGEGNHVGSDTSSPGGRSVNVVRFRVKPGREQEFLGAIGRSRPNGRLERANMIKNGDRTYFIIAEWADMHSLAKARPLKILPAASALPPRRSCPQVGRLQRAISVPRQHRPCFRR